MSLSAGDEIHLRFSLPQGGQMLHTTGTVVWRTAQACGVRFSYIPDDERLALEQWLTACVERSLAECASVCGRCAREAFAETFATSLSPFEMLPAET